MIRPLSITSTTNFHALGNYGTLTLLGITYTMSSRSQALDELLTPRVAGVLMTLMIGLGFSAFVICLKAPRRKDPTTLLMAEAIILWALSAVLSTLLVAVSVKWGPVVAMTSSVLLFGILLGSVGRAFQAWSEYRHLMRVRQAPRSTIEVAAEPDQE